MASLCDYLRIEKKLDPYLVTTPAPPFSSREILSRVSSSLSEDTSLIIRDMRDSTEEQISRLKKIAPVIVIDDLGKGRDKADFAVDLLPNLVHPITSSSFSETPFLYGYNFTKSITELPAKMFAKDIDFCIYAGFNADQRYIDFLLSLIPDDANAVILDGRQSLLFRRGQKIETDMAYPFPMLFGKNLISHFGITLFEGSLCGCRLFSINPSDYHSKLADRAAILLGLENFGVYPSIDEGAVKNSLKEAATVPTRNIRSRTLKRQVRKGFDLFFDKIKPFI